MNLRILGAIAQSQSLITVFRSLIDDPECGVTPGLVDSLYSFEQQLSQNFMNADSASVLEIERYIEELTLALGDTSDPDLLDDIATELSIARLDLISAKSYQSANMTSAQGEARYNGYYTAAESLRNFFGTLPQLQNCRNKLGRQFVQLLGNGLTVGSYFINPALSVAMSGASSIVTTAMDAIYEVARKRKTYKLSEATLPTAFSCSSEVLTNMYCETLRAERIVKKYADWEEDQDRTWEGIPFVIRRLTPLLDWLELVRAGSPASDSFDAQRRLEVMELNSTLDELKQKVDGFISETDAEIETLDIDLNNYIMTKIDFLVNLLKGSEPIVTLNGMDYLPFRLIGFTEVPRCSYQGRLDRCNNLGSFKLFYHNGTDNPGYTFSLRDWQKAKDINRVV